jgi:hypothetical protein
MMRKRRGQRPASSREIRRAGESRDRGNRDRDYGDTEADRSYRRRHRSYDRLSLDRMSL